MSVRTVLGWRNIEEAKPAGFGDGADMGRGEIRNDSEISSDHVLGDRSMIPHPKKGF